MVETYIHIPFFFLSFFFLLLGILGEDALLPAPQNISILSTNMKHFLTWSPVIIQGETVRYSVEFQGEYEREYANESWIPISECSLITATVCNITEDISATVAYNLRVRADVGPRRSEWGTLKGFFNRVTTSLTPPLMKVIAGGYHLLVELEDMGPAFQFCVVYWKKGQESRVKVSSVVHLDTMEAGPDYCVKAQTYVEAINRSSSFSQTQCVRAQGNSRPSFLFPWFLFANVLPILCAFVLQKVSEAPTQLILCGSEEAEQCDVMVCVMPSEEVLRLWIQETL
uniref:Interleukin 20 receptor subunit beta n=1 Tax=Buteo japonicus TaxID=224669 RepID=A0A8C0AVX7_9AVES